VSSEDRMYIHFALGRVLGGKARYQESFENYARANAIKRMNVDYDPEALTKHVRACMAILTQEFFQARAGTGCDAPGPIFILGMQRAGSTLVEQILASHSAVEATAELPNISLLAEHIGESIAPLHGSNYPDVLAKLDAGTLRSFGEQYLETTRSHRKLGRAFFTDKMPYNFLHVGLIHLILPNAKIIDARRNPAAACWSQFSVQFKMTNLRLTEFARAWCDYAELMAHFDAVLPGKIHRVIYEDLVTNTEAEVRRLLEYLGLSFEESCLRFYETKRAVMTPSSEQVRKPITREAIHHWRHFEPWLGPMLKTLGDAFTCYPEVPADLR
jgi:hypothetical protein